MRGFCLFVLSVLLLPLGARAEEKLNVVATFSVLADLSREIGGDAVLVTMLVPYDGDAHTYQPKPSDVLAVKTAQVVVTNGLGMEGWIDRLLRAAGGHGARIIATTGITPRTMQEAGRTITDPHAWQDPANGLVYVTNLADGFAKADPGHADLYHANADKLAAEITEVDGWIGQQLTEIPPEKRKIITSHDAFGYFGARYGIIFRGVQGISTESEPTPRDIEALVKQIKHDKIRAVFMENMTDPRYAEMLAKEAGARVGPAVYSDALSPPGGPADTYVAMFRHNVPLFVAAMGAN